MRLAAHKIWILLESRVTDLGVFQGSDLDPIFLEGRFRIRIRNLSLDISQKYNNEKYIGSKLGRIRTRFFLEGRIRIRVNSTRIRNPVWMNKKRHTHTHLSKEYKYIERYHLSFLYVSCITNVGKRKIAKIISIFTYILMKLIHTYK